MQNPYIPYPVVVDKIIPEVLRPYLGGVDVIK